MKNFLFSLILLSSGFALAQIDSSLSNITFSGYAEVYYQYDFNVPADHNRPSFFYSHPRHNEFSLNLGYIKAAYSTKRLRSNLSLAAGRAFNSKDKIFTNSNNKIANTDMFVTTSLAISL